MEAGVCKNCSQAFPIEPEDFAFYKRIDVPPPTWCWRCRMQRRLMFRNERALYRRTCTLCKKDILASYSDDKPFVVYCHECWYSDKWNPMDHGREFDFSRPFFPQFQELLKEVPRQHLYNRNSTNAQYANGVVDSKNVYLGFSVLHSEDVLYSKSIDKSFHIMDSMNLQECELCYGLVDGESNNSCEYLVQSHANVSSSYLYDSNGCTNCFMSSSIRGSQYVFRNQKLLKAEYEQRMAEIDFGSYRVRQDLAREFENLQEKAIHKYSHITNAPNSSGNCLENSKHAGYCFDAYDLEHVKYAYRILDMKDSMDVCYSGLRSELVYEYITGGTENYNLKFVTAGIQALQSTEYSDSCGSSSFLFGCAGLRSKQYCIFNKQYDKETYEALKEKIVAHMRETGEYGEFFPPELSPYAYNESIAQEYFPMTREQVIAKSWRWKEAVAPSYAISLPSSDLPDNIRDVSDDILKEVIGCEHGRQCDDLCTTAFKITANELDLYRRRKLPLPRLCPNCRHFARMKLYPPIELYDRSCMFAGCNNAFKTPYAPGRPEILYCEQHYNSEIL